MGGRCRRILRRHRPGSKIRCGPARPAPGDTMTPELNGVIHATNRLQICAFLNSMDLAEFGAIRDMLGVADSVTSKHLKVLEQARYVKLSKPIGHGRVLSLIHIS